MHRVTDVKPLDDYKLLVTFDGEEKRIYDASCVMKGVLSKLKNKGFFKTARVNMGAVEWPGGLDLCPDSMYMQSAPDVEEIYSRYGIGLASVDDFVKEMNEYA